VSFAAKFQEKPKCVVPHVPPVKGLANAMTNGKDSGWDGKKKTLAVG